MAGSRSSWTRFLPSSSYFHSPLTHSLCLFLSPPSDLSFLLVFLSHHHLLFLIIIFVLLAPLSLSLCRPPYSLTLLSDTTQARSLEMNRLLTVSSLRQEWPECQQYSLSLSVDWLICRLSFVVLIFSFFYPHLTPTFLLHCLTSLYGSIALKW